MRGERIVEGPVLPLLLRALLLLVTTVLAITQVGVAAASGPALALLVVIALGAVPLPGRTAPLIQAFAEITVLALVIGSQQPVVVVVDGTEELVPLWFAFVPLLLPPVFVAGQRGGLLIGSLGGVVAGLAWTLAILSTTGPYELVDQILDPVPWTILLVATGLIGGWLSRLTRQNRTYSDNAYEDAFRLLTALQEVARNLSLGLDPTTLSAGLVDEVGRVLPRSSRRVSVRTGEGRLAPLVGDGVLSPTGADTAQSAWTTGRRASTTAPGGREHHAFPVRMGSRVVAVLDIQSDRVSSPDAQKIEAIVTEVGPKLAAALVFDEVRQLATVDERLRLAREIHDGVAQELASVGYLLDDLATRVPPEAAEELHVLRSHVRRVTGELRLSIFDLRAGVDDTVGLGTALSEHVQRVGQQSDLVVHTVLDEHGDRLPATTEVELLRIAQEAVTNVRKHARAGNLWVECTVDAPRAWLRIADDGVGLQPARALSMGMRGMQERTRRIGGELSVSERPGGGTVLEVSIGDWDEGAIHA